MKVFLDTSAMVKAFHYEQGSDTMFKLLSQRGIIVWISELTKIEYKSALFRRYNNKQISETDLQIAFEGFNSYLHKITIEPINSIVITEAENLFEKYNTFGLRTLDAIQFASFNLLANNEIKFVTADERLCKTVESEGFNVINPNYFDIDADAHN